MAGQHHTTLTIVCPFLKRRYSFISKFRKSIDMAAETCFRRNQKNVIGFGIARDIPGEDATMINERDFLNEPKFRISAGLLKYSG